LLAPTSRRHRRCRTQELAFIFLGKVQYHKRTTHPKQSINASKEQARRHATIQKTDTRASRDCTPLIQTCSQYVVYYHLDCPLATIHPYPHCSTVECRQSASMYDVRRRRRVMDGLSPNGRNLQESQSSLSLPWWRDLDLALDDIDVTVDGETAADSSAPAGAPPSAQGSSSMGPTSTSTPQQQQQKQQQTTSPSSSMPTTRQPQPSSSSSRSPSSKPSKAHKSGAPSMSPTDVPSAPSMPPTPTPTTTTTTTPSMPMIPLASSFSPSEGPTTQDVFHDYSDGGLFVTAPTTTNTNNTNPRESESNSSESSNPNPNVGFQALFGPVIGVATISIAVVLLLFFAFGRTTKKKATSTNSKTSSSRGQRPQHSAATEKGGGGDDDIRMDGGGSARQQRDPTTQPPVETALSMDVSTLYDSPSQKADETFFQYSFERQRTNATMGSHSLSVLQSIIGCGTIGTGTSMTGNGTSIPEGEEDNEHENENSTLALERGDGEIITRSPQPSNTREQGAGSTSMFRMFFAESPFSQQPPSASTRQQE
jgi:hypothetical protein